MWFVLLFALRLATGEAYLVGAVEVGHKRHACLAAAEELEANTPRPEGFVLVGICQADI